MRHDDQSVTRINGPAEAVTALISATESAKRTIDLFSHQLNPAIYGNEEFVENVSHLVRRSAQSRLRILLRDTRPLYGSDHPLLTLVYRVPSHAQIKRYIDGAQNPNYGFLCVDLRHLVYFSDESVWSGFARLDAPAESRTRLDEFNTLWTYGSKNDPNLKRLTL